MRAAAWFARSLRAGDGLGELAGAEAVLEALNAEVTVVWGCARPTDAAPGYTVKWLKTGDGPFTEAEARTEAARHPSWWLVRREVVEIDFTTPWLPVESTT